VALTLTPFGQN